MKLDCARHRPSYRNNKQKRRWYKKVRWIYYKGNARGSMKFGHMAVTKTDNNQYHWVATGSRTFYGRHEKYGTEKTRELAQKRAFDACRKLVGLEYTGP